MKYFFTIILYTVSNLFVHSNSVDSRVLMGSPALLGDFPWMAALRIQRSTARWFCGGSVINKEWVLTSAFCIQGAKSIEVLTGIVDLNDTAIGINSSVDTFLVHEHYNESSLQNDIGLIKLNMPLEFNDNIHAIPLAENSLPDNQYIEIIGWGGTEYNNVNAMSNTLNSVNIMSLSNYECEMVFGKEYIFESTLCAGWIGNSIRGPCMGDSGGPAIIYQSNTPYLVGVISFIANAGCNYDSPSGYARVSYYRDWIAKRIGVEDI